MTARRPVPKRHRRSYGDDKLPTGAEALDERRINRGATCRCWALALADDLDEILAWREERTVTQNLTLHYDRMMLLLEPTPLARGLVRKKVAVVNYPDGRFAVQFNGMALGFKLFDKIQTVQPGAIVDNKRLSAVLEQVQAQQAAYPACQQRGHAARQRPPNNLEAPGLPSKGRPPRHGVAAVPA